MLPEHDNFDNDPLGRLADALLEHQPDDPNFGDPAGWPTEYDSIRVTTGPCTRHEDRLDTLFVDLPPEDVDIEF